MEGAITEDEALKNADSANNVRLRLKLHDEGGVAAISTQPPAPQPAAQMDVKDWGLVDERDEPGS